jgi:Ca-activated chloride channel family protein
MVSLNCRVNRAHLRTDRKNTVFVSAEVGAEKTPHSKSSLDVCLAVDCSGSMRGRKIDMAKKAAILIVDSLRPTDYISVITFAGKAKVVVLRQRVDEKEEIKERIMKVGLGAKTILLGAATNLYDGIRTGHEQLAGAARSQTGRLILLTDGEPTEGPTHASSFMELSKRLRGRGVSITALGVGNNYNEELLIVMAEASEGRWHHVEDMDQLPAIFGQELLDMESVVVVRPMLQVNLLSGAELSNVYRVGEMVTEITDYQKSDGGYVIPLEDVRAESTSKIVFKLHVPPKPEGELKIARLTLTAPRTELAKDVTVRSTSDSSLWGEETDPYPRTLLTLAQATVVAREAVNDPTLVKQARDLMETVMRDSDAATTIRGDPSLMGMGNTVMRVTETVVRGNLTEEEKKKLKQDVTVIRK